MYKGVSLVLVIVVAVFFSSAAYAAEGAAGDAMAKLQRGFLNTATGWVEVPSQISKGFKEGFGGNVDNKIGGIVAGTVEGVLAGVGRTFSGVVEVLTFWAKTPASNEGVGIALENKLAWEEDAVYDLENKDVETTMISPMTEKFKRGIANLLFGIAEIPGQMKKGISEKAYDFGLINGLVNFVSREISGAVDLATVFIPTPKDAIGMHFDDEYPWDALAN